MDMGKIDPNMVTENKIKTDDLDFYNIRNTPFKIFGVFYDEDEKKFLRMPDGSAQKVSDRMRILSKMNAGGRVKFRCNSDVYAIITKQPNIHFCPHMSTLGMAGFDLYVDNTYNKSFVPGENVFDGGYSSRINVRRYNGKVNDITINFPPFSEVSEVLIGVKKGSIVEECSPYSNEKPIVYYGSSITHGASASRPGNSYENFISRKLNVDYINLGFAGNCHAEPEMADYINSLDMDIFVYDYDHNSKTIDILKETHMPFYEKIRSKNPTLPIIMASRPEFNLDDIEIKRRDVIQENYLKAKKSGDDNVYFIDGSVCTLNYGGLDSTVDGGHPNDLGFFGMANSFANVIEKIYEKRK